MSRHPEREKASRSTGSARKGKGKGKGRLLLGVVVSVLAACGGEREEPVLVLHAEPGTAEVSPTPVPEQVPEGGERVGTVLGGHRPAQEAPSAARPAAIRAVCTRNGEHET